MSFSFQKYAWALFLMKKNCGLYSKKKGVAEIPSRGNCRLAS